MRRSLAPLFAVGVAFLGSSPLRAAPNLELYGTFNAMGVIVTLAPGDDPDLDATATVAYRTGSATYAPGLPLVRTDPTHFVGSLFWLLPGTSYDVHITLHDPGDVLDNAVLSGTGATRAEIVLPPATASYTVSPTGSGTLCTLASPCSLAQGLSRVHAGEEVVLRGGTYATGALSLSRSGTAAAPIVVRASAGETPILDGADPQQFAWAAQGGGVYSTTVNVADPHLVAANGQRLYPYATLGDLQSLAWGVAGFFANGTSVTVHLAGGADPNAAAMVVSRFNVALLLDQDFVYLIGLAFRHYGQGSYAKGIYFYGASDNLVRGCTFTLCDLGIGLKYGADRNVIEDNDFSDTIFGWPWDAVKAGSELETGGVRMYDPMTGRGTVIRRNVFHDFFDGFGVCPESDPGTTSETDVSDNLGFDLGDDGMETDGTCSNVRILRNTFHDVLVGISLAPVYVGPVYAIRNLIYRTGMGNSSYTGTCFKFNSGSSASGAMQLYHNTCDAVTAGSDGLDIRSPGSWAAITARNNIWSGAVFALSNANPSEPLDLDYDDLYTSQPNELAWWSGLGHLRTLGALTAATGEETHGRSQAPGFAAGSYALGPASSLVNAGLVIPGVNDDFAGTAPDLGAFELRELIFVDGFENGLPGGWSAKSP